MTAGQLATVAPLAFVLGVWIGLAIESRLPRKGAKA
jgi:hypothetical protein